MLLGLAFRNLYEVMSCSLNYIPTIQALVRLTIVPVGSIVIDRFKLDRISVSKTEIHTGLEWSLNGCPSRVREQTDR